MPADQVLSAQSIYNARSVAYDDSWHPTLALDYVSWASPLPGQHVLDLACGTGLVSLLAKRAVGPTGTVTGIDVSDGMMDIAKEKARVQDLEVEFIHHDIADLEALKGGRIRDDYDLITCTTALVLLDDPAKAIKQWAGLLRPGGRLITDVPTEDTQPQGLIFEEVGRELGVKVPFYRSWVTGGGSLQGLMIDAGLGIERAWTSRQYSQPIEVKGDSGGALFDRLVPDEESGIEQDERDKAIGRFVCGLGAPDVREKARKLFVEKVKKAAGRDHIVPTQERLYIVIGRKT